MTDAIYDALWQSFDLAVNEDALTADPYLTGTPDTRRGVTAAAFIAENNHTLAAKIHQAMDVINVVAPGQYVYPLGDLHLTLLSVISCREGFVLSSVDQQRMRACFDAALTHIAPMRIAFKGVTATPDAVLVKGVVKGEGLQLLRDKLRTAFASSGLPVTVDARYKLTTAHITAMRFAAPIANSAAFRAVIESYRDYSFGELALNHCDLVINDWYQSAAERHLISRVSLATTICQAAS